MDNKRYLILDVGDNIGVATSELPAGTELNTEAGKITLQDAVEVGHKFALKMINKGEKITKYQTPIGSATRVIQTGEYIHTHNMESDYLPTYTFTQGREFGQEKIS